MPPAQARASRVVCNGGRDIAATVIETGASQPQVDIFEIRFELLIKAPELPKKLGAKQTRGPRRKPDIARVRKLTAIGTAMS